MAEDFSGAAFLRAEAGKYALLAARHEHRVRSLRQRSRLMALMVALAAGLLASDLAGGVPGSRTAVNLFSVAVLAAQAALGLPQRLARAERSADVAGDLSRFARHAAAEYGRVAAAAVLDLYALLDGLISDRIEPLPPAQDKNS